MGTKDEKKIVIIDYGLGNLFSVMQACKSLGYNPIVSNDPIELKNSDAAILPGVGAFKVAMENLTQSGMKDGILEFVADKKPLMGVCLGLQLLFERSEEFEECYGLGLVEGTVKKLAHNLEQNIKVPQIGWNTIYSKKEACWKESPLGTTAPNEFMYFVHSYYVLPTQEADILTQTTYHEFEYCSSIKKENIFAAQFHPEKSGSKGIEIYKKWLTEI